MNIDNALRYIIMFFITIVSALGFIVVILAIFSQEIPEIILKILFVVLAFFIPVVVFVIYKTLFNGGDE